VLLFSSHFAGNNQLPPDPFLPSVHLEGNPVRSQIPARTHRFGNSSVGLEFVVLALFFPPDNVSFILPFVTNPYDPRYRAPWKLQSLRPNARQRFQRLATFYSFLTPVLKMSGRLLFLSKVTQLRDFLAPMLSPPSFPRVLSLLANLSRGQSRNRQAGLPLWAPTAGVRV